MKRIHFMGIGGSGASAAAAVAAHAGFSVTGCDTAGQTEYSGSLPSLVKWHPKHDPMHLAGVDLLVLSPAVSALDPTNSELREAIANNIPVTTWPQFVGQVLQKGKVVLAVCGTHGKSTTTALIGLMLEEAGLDPTVMVGAVVPKWQANYRVGESSYFVIEADEYNNSFHAYHPSLIVLTNLEYDHPEFFSSFGEMVKSFVQFVGNLKKGGAFVFDPQDPGTNKLRALLQVRKVPAAMRHITEADQVLARKAVHIPGEFNRRNAALANAATSLMGVTETAAKRVLRHFHGIGRRFELVGAADDIAVYDDYAHHPTAIARTLEAARARFKDGRLWVVWEPHMFTRTKVLWKDFVRVFNEGAYDHAVIVDIYPAREQDPGDVSSKQLVAEIADRRVEYRSMSDVPLYIAQHVKRGDYVLCMGAGDSSKLSRAILTAIKEYHD